jgi:hypothetical protein
MIVWSNQCNVLHRPNTKTTILSGSRPAAVQDACCSNGQLQKMQEPIGNARVPVLIKAA